MASKINLFVDNEKFTVKVCEDMAEKLMEGEYTEELIQNLVAGQQQVKHPKPDERSDAAVPAELDGMTTDEENKPSQGLWNRAATTMLISARHDAQHNFQHPKSTKNKLWNAIAATLKKEGFAWATGAMCDRKWRNLMTTYKRIKYNNKKSGSKRMCWEYFDTINDLLHDKPCSKPAEHLLGSSFLPQCNVGVEKSNEESSTNVDSSMQLTLSPSLFNLSTSPEVPDGTARTSKVSHRSMPAPAWFTEYVEKQQEHEKRKAEVEQARWQEMKDIEKAKVDALNKMTKTLSSIFKR